MKRLLIFDSAEKFLRAYETLSKVDSSLETFSPHDLKNSNAFAGKESIFNMVKIATLGGAFAGILTGALLVWYSQAIDAPLNVGGRPLNSWPVAIPVVWILAVLFSGLGGFFMFLWRLRFPEPWHPVFDFSNFQLQKDHYYILLPSNSAARDFSQLGATQIEEASK